MQLGSTPPTSTQQRIASAEGSSWLNDPSTVSAASSLPGFYNWNVPQRAPLIRSPGGVVGCRQQDEPVASGRAINCDIGLAVTVVICRHRHVVTRAPRVHRPAGKTRAR